MKPYYLNKTRDRPFVLASLIAWLQSLPASKAFKVEITEQRGERTLAQNNTLWGLAYPVICEATGYTPDELHEAFCKKFFGTVEKVDVFGEVSKVPFRTTTTNEHGKRDVIDLAVFSRFYDMVCDVAAECNVTVPEPDPLWRGVPARLREQEAA